MMTVKNFVKHGRKIVAVGRNYRDHRAELNNPVPKVPMLFMKPTTAYLEENNGPIVIPVDCQDLHHEVELAVVVGRRCRDVAAAAVMEHVAGYALALDMTARDLQEQCKSKGQPWEIAKGFDTSLPISRFISKEELPEPQDVELWCKVNGAQRQRGTTADMVFGIPELLAYISRRFTLEAGDLVLTGTPAGVGQVKAGDLITCGVGDVLSLSFTVAGRDE